MFIQEIVNKESGPIGKLLIYSSLLYGLPKFQVSSSWWMPMCYKLNGPRRLSCLI